MDRKLIFIELNEINFDTAYSYIEGGEDLPGFKKLFENGITNTISETEYENLEPWVAAKITKAADYLEKAFKAISYDKGPGRGKL